MINRSTGASSVRWLYFLLLVPCFFPLIFQGQVLYQWDIFRYFEPIMNFMARNIQQGHCPLWNPMVGCGAPQIAVISPGLFYLPNALFLWLTFGQGLTIALIFHQWLAGTGSYLFLKQTGRSHWAATIAGATVMLSGYMFGSTQCYTLPATFAWTPLGLFVLCKLAQSPSLKWAASLALVFGMQILAGRPELFLSAATIYLGYAASLVLCSKDFARRPMFTLHVLTALLLGIGLAAVALLPVLELYSLSPRMSGLRFSEVATWSAGWFDWLQVILTRPFGDLVISKYYLNPHYPGLFPYISSLYLGAPAVTLAAVGFCDRQWNLRWFWMAVGMLFFLLALGSFSPLLPLLCHISPSMAVLRYPIKLAVFPLFCLSIACAHGWDRISTSGAGRLTLTGCAGLWAAALLTGTAITIGIDGIASWLCSHILKSHSAVYQKDMLAAIQNAGLQLSLVSLLGLGAICLVVAYQKRLIRESQWLSAMGVLVIVPLLINGPSYLWHTADKEFYYQNSQMAYWMYERHQQTDARLLDFLPDSLLSPRWMWRENDPQMHSILLSQFERQILEPDTNIDFGIKSPIGFMPTDTKAFMMLYHGICIRTTQSTDPNRIGPVSDAPLHRFCQITNTRYLFTLTGRPNPVAHTIEPMPRLDPRYFKPVNEFPQLEGLVYEVNGCLPRAYFRQRWQPVQNQVAALKEIYWADRSSFDPGESVLINTEGGTLSLPAVPNDDSTDSEYVDIWSESGEEVDLKVVNQKPGFCVLADTHYPGWKAYDGDRTVQIYQANGFLRAVWLEPGTHVVKFKYKPYSLFWGALLSGGSLFVIVSFLLSGYWKKRKKSNRTNACLEAEHSA